MLKASILLAALTQAVTSTFILLPLYLYPTPGAWDPVYKAVSQYPKIQWQIVVNPNSGPGAANSYPDSTYTAAIAKLNAYKNVKTLGYVRTNYTNRAYNDVITDIATYANWASYSASNISMAGIFFDEATISSSPAAIQYMQNASTYAYDNVPSQITPVIFNPGTSATPTQYFQYADTIVEFEDYYSAYKDQATINSIPSGYQKQSAIIVHSSTATQTQLNALVHNIIKNKIGGVYFTDDCCYNAIKLLPSLTQAVSLG